MPRRHAIAASRQSRRPTNHVRRHQRKSRPDSTLAYSGLAFGGYILALASLSTGRAVGLVLGVTVLIPLGDVLFLLAVRGFSSPGHLLLHLASAGVMAAAAAWMLRRA